MLDTRTRAATASPAPLSLHPIPDSPGCLQAAVTHVNATSYIIGKDPTAYAPQRMIDGDETTAFQFSTKKTKLGKEYLYFEFETPVALDELWIKNGFWEVTNSYNQYTRNSRPKKITVDFLYSDAVTYSGSQSFTLKDDKSLQDWQRISLGRRNDVAGVRIRIDSIYQGTRYKNDVCISELMFVQNTASY